MPYASLITQGIGLAGSLAGGLSSILGTSEAERRIKDRMRGKNLVAQRMFDSNMSALQSKVNALQSTLAPSLGAGFSARVAANAMAQGATDLGNQASVQAAAEQQAAEGQALAIDQRRQQQILGMIGGAADAVGSFGGALSTFGEGEGGTGDVPPAPLDPGAGDPTGMAMANLGAAGARPVDPETLAAMTIPAVENPNATVPELMGDLSPETYTAITQPQQPLAPTTGAVGTPTTGGISSADLNQFLLPPGARERWGAQRMRQHAARSEALLGQLGAPRLR